MRELVARGYRIVLRDLIALVALACGTTAREAWAVADDAMGGARCSAPPATRPPIPAALLKPQYHGPDTITRRCRAACEGGQCIGDVGHTDQHRSRDGRVFLT